jgi:hypothetical protein
MDGTTNYNGSAYNGTTTTSTNYCAAASATNYCAAASASAYNGSTTSTTNYGWIYYI